MKNFLLIALMMITTAAHAATVDFKPADGKTEFSAVGKPAMIKINGHGTGPEGKLTVDKGAINGTLNVDLTQLTTDIELRDDHMKNKYLEVQKFPKSQITFKDFKPSVAFDQLTGKETEMPFTADLTLRGKTQPISGTVKLKKSSQKLEGEAEFSVKIMTFLETLPSYAGIKVAEDVKVKIKLNGTIQ